ncbi:ATP-binding protein [Streptomyces sp. Ru71]|uniref:ATP-binding protein n=1 Tax=Streptomyces sp. Ru71 TaxID=2080746 RepID=UPI000CDD7835|nr:ATP-binding protein [Streptomyces sp. Ru71]POX46101.1 ATP-binding protein [Streptomyces sp. Ru71]
MSTQHATDPLGGDRTCEECGPCCPADVRAAVRSAVDRRRRTTGADCDEEALSDALLVASELASNAILHGGGVTGFTVDLVAGGVRVSVCDRSRRLPVAAAPTDAEGRRRVGGRGWPIVCRLSRDVHVTDLPAGGKRITAEVPV